MRADRPGAGGGERGGGGGERAEMRGGGAGWQDGRPAGTGVSRNGTGQDVWDGWEGRS